MSLSKYLNNSLSYTQTVGSHPLTDKIVQIMSFSKFTHTRIDHLVFDILEEYIRPKI